MRIGQILLHSSDLQTCFVKHASLYKLLDDGLVQTPVRATS